MDFLAPVKRFDRYQQQHRSLAVPLAVVRKFGNDQGGALAALVAYFGFFSLFPLLLVMTTILGFVLHGNPSAQASVQHSVLGQFPVIGSSIKLHSLQGSVASLVIGLVTSLLGGLGVTSAAQNAFDRVWAVPFKDRPDFLKTRLRGLATIASLGVLFVISTVVAGFVSGIHGPVGKLGALAVGFALNYAIFLAAFRFLTAATIDTKCLWIGVSVAAVFWELLQYLGGYYINHTLKHLSPVSSQFGLVIGLLVFMHLGAQLTLYAAELNVVISRGLYPRSLLGPPEQPADEETLRALAKVEERHDIEEVEVVFHPVDENGEAQRPDGPRSGPPAPAPAPASTLAGVVKAAAFGFGVVAGVRHRPGAGD